MCWLLTGAGEAGWVQTLPSLGSREGPVKSKQGRGTWLPVGSGPRLILFPLYPKDPSLSVTLPSQVLLGHP